MDQQRDGDKVLHQDAVEEVIDDRVEETAADTVDDQLVATSDHAAIADLAAPSNAYVEAEALAARGKINEILDVLRDANLIPT